MKRLALKTTPKKGRMPRMKNPVNNKINSLLNSKPSHITRMVSVIERDFTRRDLNNFIIRFYITTPFWGLLLKYNVI
jgi:hypothetical protein